MMTKEEREVYMSLSNDPNERGRLWKNHPMRKLQYERTMGGKMSDYYNEQFLKSSQQLEKKV